MQHVTNINVSASLVACGDGQWLRVDAIAVVQQHKCEHNSTALPPHLLRLPCYSLIRLRGAGSAVLTKIAKMNYEKHVQTSNEAVDSQLLDDAFHGVIKVLEGFVLLASAPVALVSFGQGLYRLVDIWRSEQVLGKQTCFCNLDGTRPPVHSDAGFLMRSLKLTE